MARAEGAQAVAHGATGKGNDQVRFELATTVLAPDLRTIAPWREWDFASRTDLINFAKQNGIPVPSDKKGSDHSMDRNLLHLSFEGGELEDRPNEPGPDNLFADRYPRRKLRIRRNISPSTSRRDPVALHGERLSPASLIKTLNTLGGKHGIGRIDMVENRFVA